MPYDPNYQGAQIYAAQPRSKVDEAKDALARGFDSYMQNLFGDKTVNRSDNPHSAEEIGKSFAHISRPLATLSPLATTAVAGNAALYNASRQVKGERDARTAQLAAPKTQLAPTVDQTPMVDPAPQSFTHPTSNGIDLGGYNDAPMEKVGPDSAKADPAMDAINAILSGQQRETPVERASDQNAAALKTLRAPKENPVGNTKPKVSGFRKFIEAGSGPIDFDRAERHALETELMRQEVDRGGQKFNDREQLNAQIAAEDEIGATKFNRGIKEDNFKSGGLSPQAKFQLEMLHDIKMKDMDQRNAIDRLRTERAPIARDRRSVNEDLALKHPELYDPEMLKELGIDISPEALKVFQQNQSKEDPLKMIQAFFMEQMMNRMPGSQSSGAYPVGVAGPASKGPQPVQTAKPVRNYDRLNK